MDQEVGQIIHPSHGFNTDKAVLIGYYLDFRGAMRDRVPADVHRLALEHGARVHQQYPAEFETAFSVTWSRVPWNRGSWRSASSAAHEALMLLREPDGRVHFAGDYMTDGCRVRSNQAGKLRPRSIRVPSRGSDVFRRRPEPAVRPGGPAWAELLARLRTT